ncbi:MAG TPA: hypothetical protein VJH63_01695 [Candidatus Paceibacterota bacterium]
MLQFCFSYIFWHYTTAYRELYGVSKNFLWFFYHFFSIGVLARTLFSPWQKLDESYKKGFNIKAFFEVFILNTLMRILGFFIRSFVIVIGVAVLICVLVLELATFAIWTLLPLIIMFLFISGLRLLIKK